MNLSENNFSSNPCKFKQPDNVDINGTIYTYETDNAIYDIAIINGRKYYQKNMGGYSNLIDNIQPIHYAIENHYNI